MKTKNFTKKLSLNKSTISHLTIDQQARLMGGDGFTKPETVCVTCIEPSVCIACVTERTCY